jgi:hypothetical protein
MIRFELVKVIVQNFHKLFVKNCDKGSKYGWGTKKKDRFFFI